MAFLLARQGLNFLIFPQTGLCVYEVDDPSQRSAIMPSLRLISSQGILHRNSVADEKVLLRSRVAELEGVIREVNQTSTPPSTRKLTSP